HQSYQPDLAVDIERGQSQERKQQRARKSQWYRARQDDERIAETLKLGGQHQVDQDARQHEGAKELAALGPKLARFPGIVNAEALAGRQQRAGFVFQHAQGRIERNPRWNHALDAHCIEWLKALELQRLGG